MYDWIKKTVEIRRTAGFHFSRMKKNGNHTTIILSTKTIFQESNLSFQTDFKTKCRSSGRSRNRTWRVLKQMNDRIKKKQLNSTTAGFRFSRRKEIKNQLVPWFQLSFYQPKPSFRNWTWDVLFKTRIQTQIPLFWTRQESNLTHPCKKCMIEQEKQLESKEQLVFAFLEIKKIANQPMHTPTIILSATTIFQESNLRSPSSKIYLTFLDDAPGIEPGASKTKMHDWTKKIVELKRTAGFRFSRMKKIENQLTFFFQISSTKPIFQKSNLRCPFQTDFKCRFSGRSRNRTWRVLKKMFDWSKKTVKFERTAGFRFLGKKKNENRPRSFQLNYYLINQTIFQESNLKHPSNETHLVFLDAPRNRTWSVLKKYLIEKKTVELDNHWFSLFSKKENRKPADRPYTTIILSTKPIFQESNLRHPFETDFKTRWSLIWTRQESNLKRP